MSVMVDRIAAVIRAGFALDATPERIARAVLEDMREPTPAMRANGQEMLEGHPDVVTGHLIWQAMMDAALEETSGQPKETARGT